LLLIALCGQSLVAQTAVAANTCTNPIACENLLPGTPASDWRISEPGDNTIIGFATAQSVNPGEIIRFKIKTNASAYHIDILRAGWYQGNGARKVMSRLPPTARLPQTQPNCIVDSSATGLIDCGNWSESASWTVPSTAVSGVYFARLVREDTGGSSYIFFNVRNDASHSAIVYQTSDTTRAAYNTYGGNSLYECAVACPPGTPNQYKGAAKISFNRPNIAASLGIQYSFFGAEFQLVEFLEANGYDLTYISGVDTDRIGTLLKNHGVFISSGQDEYWSGNQRANVEAARDAKVHLAFFSGDEVFWKTRYENSIDGLNTPYRTLVTYKETHFDAAVDPLDPPIWTGTWRDKRFSPPADGGRPENALTGTLNAVDQGTDFAIEVPAADGKMRFWRNTSVSAQSSGQTATLAPNTLGYEWDEDQDNGARPAGIVHLSTTTHSVAHRVLDNFGSIPEGPGVATHHLVLHRAPSGALVFGAGTVQWSWGLEGSPDGTAGVDVRMQQATVNLLADMGVQPSTLIPGLVAASASSDSIPPISTISLPAPGTSVPADSLVNISGTAVDSGGGVVGGVEVSTDNGVTWHPVSGGRESWIYQWQPLQPGSYSLRSRAVDDSANLGTASNAVSVSVTPRQCPCSIWPSNVAPVVAADPDQNAIEIGVKFFADTDGLVSGIRFFKAGTNTGTHVGNLWTANGQLLARATFTNESASGWQQANFAAPVRITAGTHYVASYHTNTGHYAADVYYFFSSGFDNPPLHALENGLDGGNGVYIYGANSSFPTNSFKSSNYWVDVVFTTSSSTALTVWPSTATPTVAADPDTNSIEVGVKFRSDVSGRITGIRFYKSSTNTGTHVGSLWSSTGTLLAQATFVNETGSGWQQVNFASPVAITPGTTYIASYHASSGHYADDTGYFANSGVDNGPLHALRDGVSGANGVYTYGTTSVMPTNGYQSSNYWVDIVFSSP
jgi:hypothetical protein